MQGSLIPNNSSPLSDVNYITNIRLSTVIFSAKGTAIQNFDSKSFKFKVIQNLDLIVPIHKKSDKQNIKKYRPVSLLPICGKIFERFERLIFMEMFNYFSSNKLSLKTSPVSKPLLPVSTNYYQLPYEVFTSFDNGLDIRSVSIDISKAFDKVWPDGLIFKLKKNDISDDVFKLKQNDISGDVHAGVTQRSALGPLLFSIYINDLSDNLTCNAKVFAADTSLFLVVHDINTSAKELYE